MNIGIIYIKESYQSLNLLNLNIIKALKKIYNVSLFLLDEKILAKDISSMNKFYQKNDIIINTSSKVINYIRNIYKPTIFVWHAWMSHGAWINLYYNNFFYNKDIITFASKAEMNKYKYIYTKRLKSFLLPYFTSINKIDISEKNEKELRNKYKIPQKKKILIYFGRLSEEKNIEEMVLLHKRLLHTGVYLLIIWNYTNLCTYWFWNTLMDDKYKDKIKNLIKNKWIKNIGIIEWIDRVNLLKLLSISYIAVNLTKCFEEDFGIAAIEAMKMWLPVICSDRWWLKDIITHKKTWFVCKTTINRWLKISLKIDSAVKYIVKLIDDKKMYAKISNNCLIRAEKMYSDAKFIKNISNIISFTKYQYESNNINNEFKFESKNRIKKIYNEELDSGWVKNIYLNNHNLFNKLYYFYTSK